MASLLPIKIPLLVGTFILNKKIFKSNIKFPFIPNLYLIPYTNLRDNLEPVSKAEMMGTLTFGINIECFSDTFEFIAKLKYVEMLATLVTFHKA